MDHVITIVCGSNPQIDEAGYLAKILITAGLVKEFRPCISMGNAIEVIPMDNTERELIKQEFRNAGFEVID